MDIVTFYNHKGGVSKTTTTFNLACYLAQQGKRVLVVDADPQCNLTEVSMARTIAKLDEEAEQTGQLKELPGKSLLEILEPRFRGDVSQVDIDLIEPLEVRERLYLIRGSVDLSTIEDVLANAHDQRFSSKTHEKRSYVAMGDFLFRYGTKQKFDYVFVDVGPSSGALTRACVLATDFFFIPVAADRFNLQAIRSLSRILDRWIREHDEVVEDFRGLGLPIRPGKPIFLGAVAQYFKIYKGKPKPGYNLFISRIPSVVEQSLFPVLDKYMAPNGQTLRGELSKDDVIVAKVPDFGSLGQVMHETGKPVFDFAQGDTSAVTADGSMWTGATWIQAEERMATFRQCFGQIAARLP